jgi:hypothetical protein
MTVCSLFRDDFAATPAASTRIEAFDALGERVL